MLDGPCRTPATCLDPAAVKTGSLPMSSLLDQSALTDLAERLVAAARRSGADAADAVAVRSVSVSVEVREGAVEESQRSKGRRGVAGAGRTPPGGGLDQRHQGRRIGPRRARGGNGKSRARGPLRRLADADLLAQQVPDLDLVDPDLRPSPSWRSAPRARRRRGLPSRACPNRKAPRPPPASAHGAGDQPWLPRRLPQFAPQPLDGRYCRRRHGDGA